MVVTPDEQILHWAQDRFANRLFDMAYAMLRGRDQGHDGRYYPSDTDIEDILAAAVIVSRKAETDRDLLPPIVRGRERYSDWILPWGPRS